MTEPTQEMIERSFAWTATEGYKHYPPYVNLTGNRLTIRGREYEGAVGDQYHIDAGHCVSVDLPDEALAGLASALKASGNLERIAQLEEALTSIRQWSEAYPVGIFPEPDIEGVKQVLIANDMLREMDRMHSAWARHLLEGVGEIARSALTNGAPVAFADLCGHRQEETNHDRD